MLYTSLQIQIIYNNDKSPLCFIILRSAGGSLQTGHYMMKGNVYLYHACIFSTRNFFLGKKNDVVHTLLHLVRIHSITCAQLYILCVRTTVLSRAQDVYFFSKKKFYQAQASSH